jgi:hypothetical protein
VKIAIDEAFLLRIRQDDFEVTDTIVPAGTITSAGAELVGVPLFHAVAASHSNWVPSVQMQCMIVAILRAIATLAFFAPIRFERLSPQLLSGDPRRTIFRRTLAASYR